MTPIRSVLARCCSVLFCLGWVGLLSLFSVRPFHALFLGQLPPSSFLVQWGVVFWEVCRPRIHSLLRFLGTCVYFGLAVFSGSVLSNLQVLVSFCFFGLVLMPFFFSESVGSSYSEGLFFFWGIFCKTSSAPFFFLVLFFVALRKAALSSENACYEFLCRRHATATLTGWFHP